MSGLNLEREHQVSEFHLITRLIERISVQGIIFQSQWQFNHKRGAVLLMHRPRRTYVPDGFFEVSRGIRVLEGKFVVSEIWESPGYFWYLSHKSECSVSSCLSGLTCSE